MGEIAACQLAPAYKHRLRCVSKPEREVGQSGIVIVCKISQNTQGTLRTAFGSRWGRVGLCVLGLVFGIDNLCSRFSDYVASQASRALGSRDWQCRTFRKTHALFSYRNI